MGFDTYCDLVDSCYAQWEGSPESFGAALETATMRLPEFLTLAYRQDALRRRALARAAIMRLRGGKRLLKVGVR